MYLMYKLKIFSLTNIQNVIFPEPTTNQPKMNHKFWVLFSFVSLLTLTDYTEANNLVAYYTAAASTVLIAAAAVIFKVFFLYFL